MASKNNAKTKKIKIKASDLLFLATLTYLSQFIENILHDLIQWTPLIDNVPLGNAWWTLILRALCIAAWWTVMYFIVRSSRGCGYDPIEKTKDVKPIEWAIPTAITVAFVLFFIIWDGGFGVFWAGLKNMGGVIGTVSYLAFLAFQVALMMLTISLAQKAFEIVFPRAWKYIPFGGIFLGACMMIANVVTGIGAEGWNPLVLPLILAVETLFGLVYVLTGKRAWLAYPFVYLMFFIF